ncbi:MAG TPA: hypothetical protein VGC99_12140, partial [Candidatus Tectomicrobia bacterium]
HAALVVSPGHDAAASFEGIARRTRSGDYGTALGPDGHATRISIRGSRREMSTQAPHPLAHSVGTRVRDTDH